jgi:ankyrin repeat protein
LSEADLLFDAVTGSDLDRLRSILSAAPELSRVRNSMGDTPLHAAVQAGQVEAAQALLESGADPDARNGEGLTPLGLLREIQRETGSDPNCMYPKEMERLLTDGGATL